MCVCVCVSVCVCVCMCVCVDNRQVIILPPEVSIYCYNDHLVGQVPSKIIPHYHYYDPYISYIHMINIVMYIRI